MPGLLVEVWTRDLANKEKDGYSSDLDVPTLQPKADLHAFAV